MFQRILAWIREVIKKMLGQETVKTALGVDVAISAPMAEALQLWASMYQNDAPWLNETVKTLNLPAAIAGEIARAVTIELEVEISGSPRAEYLTAQFAVVANRLREQVEKGAAKGGLMLKPYIDGKQIAVDYVQADMFYPVAFDSNGHITSCVFADCRTVGDKYYTRMEYHAMGPDGCNIRNLAFRSTSRDALGQSVPLTVIDDWAYLLPEATITGIDRPLFAYFRYPLANNIDPSSPLGVSCYSRAIDLIQDADKQWSDLMWEFESGQRALYADVTAFEKKADGTTILPMKRLYRALNGTSNIGDNPEGLFHDWSPDFRDASIKSGLDAILKRIEFATGLAYGTLSDPATTDKTATEIATSKQRTYATVTDAQKSLQAAIERLIWAMDIWATIGNLAPKGAYKTAFDFDDSLIVDSEMQFSQDLRTVGQGAMPKWMFLVRNYGLTEETAKKWVSEVDQEGQSVYETTPVQ